MGDAIDPRKLVAEAIGVFALVFVGAGAIVVAAGNANIGLVEIALAHGLAIAVMISALGHISGGHFNPAVTIGFWVTRRMGTPLSIAYVLAQLLGGVLGAVALTALFPEGLRSASDLGTPALGPGIEFLGGIGIEIILTFFLVLVIFGTAVDSRSPNLGGFAIGLTITLDILVAGPLTGAVMNPARAFGPALLSGQWGDQAVWWIGPLIGGVIAAMLYHYLFSEEAEALASRAT
ncbi:MAG: aquaporin [Chloroflexi bacterium]|nr:aquaporin [Chloroflexota bacterium]